MMQKIKLDTKGASVGDKLNTADNVVGKLLGNALFPKSQDLGSELDGATNALRVANNNTIAGRQTQLQLTIALNLAEDNWDLIYGKVAEQVGIEADNDPVKALSAGFALRANGGGPVTMTQVMHLALTVGDNAGSLDGMCDPVPGKKNYEAQISTDPMSESSWVFHSVVSASSFTLAGLTSGTLCWVRLRALGGNDRKGPWSDPTVKRVP